MQAVGEVTGCKFQTQGCHDKWYPKWSVPVLEGNKYMQKIDKNFLDKVELELYENLMASKCARPRAHSDSSNCIEGAMALLQVINLEKKVTDLKTKSVIRLRFKNQK